jgi:C-terminal processing protease CtpA/Prc
VKPLAINSKMPTDIETKLVPTIEQAIEKKMLIVDGLELSPIIGSPAAKAGISDKDKLVTIDGKTFEKPEQMVEYVSGAKNPLQLVIERK